jgi:hypothetical protein
MTSLEAGKSDQDELEVITAIVRKASTGKSSLPVCFASMPIWRENKI